MLNSELLSGIERTLTFIASHQMKQSRFPEIQDLRISGDSIGSNKVGGRSELLPDYVRQTIPINDASRTRKSVPGIQPSALPLFSRANENAQEKSEKTTSNDKIFGSNIKNNQTLHDSKHIIHLDDEKPDRKKIDRSQSIDLLRS